MSDADSGITTHADLRTEPPSAIAAFSALTISSPRRLQHKETPTVRAAWKAPAERWLTGPHALPTEIIEMIFHFMFESCIDPTDSSTCDGDQASWIDEDPLSPSLFPYALACVCPRWSRILRGIPVYWTRQVIALDAVSASLNAACTTLEWAGNCPLKVIVTRHRGTSEPVTHASERACVGRTVTFLRPHLSRVWSLSFDVEHSSSIPALWRERGRAPRLRVLTLMSRSDAGRISRISGWNESYDYHGKLKAPLLQHAVLGGHFVKHTLMAHPRLMSWFRRITSLTVRGDASCGGHVLSLYKFLSMIDDLGSVRKLTIEDIDFDDHAPYPSLHALRPAVLCLRRVTGTAALTSLLILAHAETRSREDITLVDCAVHGVCDLDWNMHFASTSLTIECMNPDARIEDLVCRWNGEQLSVIRCRRVSRAFLERLHGAAAPTRLSRLCITDCDGFCGGDVVSLVQSRATQAACVSLMGAADEDAFGALSELRVQGRGPPISAQRATWLAAHVALFSWDTVAKDGMRYVWDGSAERLRTSEVTLAC